MLRPRVIPCLSLADDGLVKTVRFDAPRYVGDPANVISIFNQLEVDELLLLDIRATVEDRPPPFDVIRHIADLCTAPLSYGGGIRSVEDVQRVLEIGVEKVVIGTRAAETPALVTQAASRFGSQAVVVAVDARRKLLGRYEVRTRSGTRSIGVDPVEHARRAESLGAGELLLTSIDRDGTMDGYDVDLIRRVRDAVGIPVIACGGAGARADLARAVLEGGASAAAAGSLFVYQGRERGVLVNFPSQRELDGLWGGAGRSAMERTR